jgi:hypothetical protein
MNSLSLFRKKTSNLHDDPLDECSFCQEVVTEIAGLQQGGVARDCIEDYVSVVCENTPESEDCEYIYDVKYILKKLKKNKTVQRICEKLDVCDEKSARDLIKSKSQSEDSFADTNLRCAYDTEYACASYQQAKACNVR